MYVANAAFSPRPDPFLSMILIDIGPRLVPMPHTAAMADDFTAMESYAAGPSFLFDYVFLIS